jgi:hypothetical protein
MKEFTFTWFPQKSFARAQAWLRRETDALPIDVFRILVGLLCFAYFISLLRQVADFSSPNGLLDHALLQQMYWFTRLGLFHPGLARTWMFYTVFSLACLGCWGVILGYRPKLCAAVLFVIAVSTYRWNFIVMYVDDAIIHLVLFWLLLLPVGQTLTLSGIWFDKQNCWVRWRQCRVPGMSVRCLVGNVCLVYLVAGLWKFESPMWHDGTAVYATLRLPIAYTPEFWRPEHLPWLRVANYGALVIEPALPVLLLLRRGRPIKWLGLAAQLSFHLGIIAALRIPYANLAMMATAVLFFRDEIMSGVFGGHNETPPRPPTLHRDWGGRLALVLLICLTLAMMRRLPVIGPVHKPAYALLWMVGIAQDYQLFNWIDRKNFSIRYRVIVTQPGGQPRTLPSIELFPDSLRATLLQSYLHNVRWIAVPSVHRTALKRAILERLASRFCRLHPMQGEVSAWSLIQRVRPGRKTPKARRRFVMRFQCSETEAVALQTMLNQRQISH